MSRPTRLVCAVALLMVGGLGLGASLMRSGSRPPAPGEPAHAVSLIGSERINPNTADAARLTLLPRIGPALAERIVADREANGAFTKPGDLARVRGIGPKTVERIAALLTFDDQGTPISPAGDGRAADQGGGD